MNDPTTHLPFAGLDEQAAAAGCAAQQSPGNDTCNLPTVFLPGGTQTITSSATQLGALLGPKHAVFNRGGAVVMVRVDDAGQPIVEPVKAAALASVFELVARLVVERRDREQIMAAPAVCTEQVAKVISACPAFLDALPPLRAISPCPVLVAGANGCLRQVSGYDLESGIFARASEVLDVPLAQAKDLLKEILADYQFATKGDHARALAAMITPALIQGQLLHGRAPIDLGEANDSQAGKSFRNRLTASIYGQTVHVITQKKGGVGGIEEALSRHLINGATFVAFDNIRGAIDCPALESALTEDVFMARALRMDAEIDPRRTIFQFTSNRAEITRDLANRSSCVRILKQSKDYKYQVYSEGDILDRVRTHQSLYLGAVFAVIRAWWAAGHLGTTETRHDFRVWARDLDWICQKLLETAPLLDGHEEIQERVSSPHLAWLRSLAIEVFKMHRDGVWLTTTNIVDIASNSGAIELPGSGSTAESDNYDKNVLQAVGRRLKGCFGDSDCLSCDEFIVERKQTMEPRKFAYMGGPFPVNTYRFQQKNRPDSGVCEKIGSPPEISPEEQTSVPTRAVECPPKDFDRQGFLHPVAKAADQADANARTLP